MSILTPYVTRILSPCLFLFMLTGGAPHLHAQTISGNETGMHSGFYYSFWKETAGSGASVTLLPNGHYTCTWNQVDNFIAGKGWETGSPTRVIDFTGSFQGGSNGNLAVYGWTRDPLIEYYVVENHGAWTPPGGILKGTVESDGGIYQIYQTSRVPYPAINGFPTYWSVRTTKRSSGTVTFANHVAAWKANGMDMGSTWNYQIMATEGYQSTGSSDITVSEKIVTGGAETSSAESKGVETYPNPVTNRLTVFLPKSQGELSLYTGKGTRILNLHAETELVELDMSEFGSGIYMLKVESEGQTFAKKVIVL